MTELNHRAEQFLDSIREEGEESCRAVREETEAAVSAELEKARLAEQKKAEQTIAFETARAASQGNRMLSEQRAALRAKLAGRRAALEDEAFADAEKRLAQFAESEEYAVWLQRSAQTLAAALGSPCTLYARAADAALLNGHLPAHCTLKTDDTIRLGGLRGAGAGKAADDTLETRLAAQREWFLGYSGLAITL